MGKHKITPLEVAALEPRPKRKRPNGDEIWQLQKDLAHAENEAASLGNEVAVVKGLLFVSERRLADVKAHPFRLCRAHITARLHFAWEWLMGRI